MKKIICASFLTPLKLSCGLKKFLLTFLIFIIYQSGFSQSLLEYKGFPVEDVGYYYLSAENNLFNDETEIYSSVKEFICDKSKYHNEIGNLSEDLKTQFEEHLGDKKHPSLTVKVHYFESLRDAKVQHRRSVNEGSVSLDYSFVYYCKE
jgi:hypothetical protein